MQGAALFEYSVVCAFILFHCSEYFLKVSFGTVAMPGAPKPQNLGR
jgi:hypothetical protein